MSIAIGSPVSRVIREEDALTIVWSDGLQSSYPHFWLRDNAPENLYPYAAEKLNEWSDGDSAAPCSPWSVSIEYDETLVISWAGLKEVNRFPLEELRSFAAIEESPELALAAD